MTVLSNVLSSPVEPVLQSPLGDAGVFVPSDIADLAFFFDARDALADGSGNLTTWPDTTGTWALAPKLDNGTINVKTDHANGVQCVEIDGRSDECDATLTGDGVVSLAGEFVIGCVFATRSNNIDGFWEVGGLAAGDGVSFRLNGFTTERAHIEGDTSSSRDAAMTDDKVAHHKIAHSTGSLFSLRNHENVSGTTSVPANMTTSAETITLGGAPHLGVTNTGDGYFWALYAYKRDIAGADLALLDAWLQTTFNCAGLTSTA